MSTLGFERIHDVRVCARISPQTVDALHLQETREDWERSGFVYVCVQHIQASDLAKAEPRRIGERDRLELYRGTATGLTVAVPGRSMAPSSRHVPRASSGLVLVLSCSFVAAAAAPATAAPNPPRIPSAQAQGLQL